MQATTCQQQGRNCGKLPAATAPSCAHPLAVLVLHKTQEQPAGTAGGGSMQSWIQHCITSRPGDSPLTTTVRSAAGV